MIDNSSGFERRETKNVLTDEAIERVIGTYKSGEAEEGWARWVADEELAAHHYNMVVRRYVSPGKRRQRRGARSGRGNRGVP